MKSKEPGTIRQLFAFVGENNGKMLLSIFLAVLGELFGIGPFLMVAVLADALYRGTATPKLVLFLCGGAAVCQIIKMLLTWRSSLMSHKISFTIPDGIARWKRWPPRAHWGHARPAPRPASKPVRAQPQSSETGNRMAGLFEKTPACLERPESNLWSPRAAPVKPGGDLRSG